MKSKDMLEMEEIFFECKRCGGCCRGRGDIPVTPMDLVRYCNHFQITGEQFLKEYARIEKKDGKLPKVFLKHKNDREKSCIFFYEGVGCSINPIKPPICYCFPFWEDMFGNGKTLVQVTPCVINSLGCGEKKKIVDVIEEASCARYHKEKPIMIKYMDFISEFDFKLMRTSAPQQAKQVYIDKFFEEFFLKIGQNSSEEYLEEKMTEWNYILCFLSM